MLNISSQVLDDADKNARGWKLSTYANCCGGGCVKVSNLKGNLFCSGRSTQPGEGDVLSQLGLGAAKLNLKRAILWIDNGMTQFFCKEIANTEPYNSCPPGHNRLMSIPIKK